MLPRYRKELEEGCAPWPPEVEQLGVGSSVLHPLADLTPSKARREAIMKLFYLCLMASSRDGCNQKGPGLSGAVEGFEVEAAYFLRLVQTP